ncbi:MAG: hypothetical protein WCV73_04545 [Patescibacteria group bacterium]|jgi:membrane-bound ClpP family serine protease
MTRLLQLSFWFDVYPLPFYQVAYWLFGGLFIACLVFGIFALVRSQKLGNKLVIKVWSKLGNFGLSFGIVGLILLFFKQQRLPYLGMRFFLGLWLLVCLVWLGFILKYLLVDLPKLKAEKKYKDELLKYIP